MIFDNKLCHTGTNIVTKVKIIHTHKKRLTSKWPRTAVTASDSPRWGGDGHGRPRHQGSTKVIFICCHGDVWLEETGSKHKVPWFPLLWTQHRLTFLLLIVPQTNKQSLREKKVRNKSHFLAPSGFLSLFDLLTSSHHLALSSRVRQRSQCMKPTGVCGSINKGCCCVFSGCGVNSVSCSLILKEVL